MSIDVHKVQKVMILLLNHDCIIEKMTTSRKITNMYASLQPVFCTLESAKLRDIVNIWFILNNDLERIS